MMESESEIVRCPWCAGCADYVDYHDTQWGVPTYDETVIFEFLTLEGAQAGLSWLTILKRRAAYAQAFDGYDKQKIAAYTDADIERLASDARIIRNRRKIMSVAQNARAALAMENDASSFSGGKPLGQWLWSFTGGKPLVNRPKTMSEVPAKTELAETISKALKKGGFSFVGPTIIYSLMQAIGIVDDHLDGCWRKSSC